MFDVLAALNAIEPLRGIIDSIGRREDGDRPADDFGGTVAVDAPGREIPGEDGAVQGLADDGVVR